MGVSHASCFITPRMAQAALDKDLKEEAAYLALSEERPSGES